MKGTPAVYLGRIVEKKHFRAVVYGPNGEKKLVKSWDEFEKAMESGLWFATVEHAEESKLPVENVEGDLKPKPKPKSKAKPKAVKVEDLDESEVAPDELDDMVFEVKDGE